MPEETKIEMFPVKLGEIIVRIENMQDNFDIEGILHKKQTPYIKLDELALALLKKAYGK